MDRLLEINRKAHFEDGRVEMIEGTNGATVTSMKNVDAVLGLLRHSLEVPISLAILLTIFIIGEKNFFSKQVHYQT